MQAVLLGGQPAIGASREFGGGTANYWRTAFRLALDEIAALVGLASKPARRPPVPERLRFAGRGDGRDGTEERHG